MGELSGKAAIVTGGSRGVGRACAIELARRGADVAIVYRASREEALKAVAEIEACGVKGLAVQADVCDAAATQRAFKAAVDALGRLDILIHSAGGQVDWRPVREQEPAAWAALIQNDLIGGFHAIQQAVLHMRPRKSGVILAISSIAAQMCQARNSQGAAAKAGLEALVRVVAREEARAGIRANAVAIGLTDTEQMRVALQQWGPEAAKRIVDTIPAGRIGTPEEIARFCAFLAGDGGAYVTGKVMQVDGGQIIAG